MRPLDDYRASGEEWFAAMFDKASEREFRIGSGQCFKYTYRGVKCIVWPIKL